MDGPRDCHTEWSASDKDNDHMVSLICEILKNLYKWTALQNRTTVTDLENKLMTTRGIHWEIGIDIYALL